MPYNRATMASIAKNATFMSIASVGQKIVSFVYFAIVARMLTTGDVGMYTTALSFTTIFVVFVDMGMTNVLVREIARKKSRTQTYLQTVLSVKLWLALGSYIALCIAVWALGYTGVIRQLIVVSGITMLLDSLHLTLYGTLRGHGDLRFESISLFASQLGTLILGSLVLYLGLPLVYLMLAFTIPSALNVLYAAIMVKKRLQISLMPKRDKKTMSTFFAIAVPFALAAIFARVYGFIDTILIQKILGNEQAGIYSVAHKVHMAFQFIPLAIIAAAYPRFSEYYSENNERLGNIFSQVLLIVFMIAAPIAVGTIVVGGTIIPLVFGDQYIASVVPLGILMISLIFLFASYPIGALLNACDRQRIQTAIVGGVMLVNIGLNILLIPTYGAAGSAIAATIGNAALAVIGYMYTVKIAPSHVGWLLKRLLAVTMAAIIMGACVYVAMYYVHIILAIGIGILTYIMLIYAFRVLPHWNIRRYFI